VSKLATCTPGSGGIRADFRPVPICTRARALPQTSCAFLAFERVFRANGDAAAFVPGLRILIGVDKYLPVRRPGAFPTDRGAAAETRSLRIDGVRPGAGERGFTACCSTAAFSAAQYCGRVPTFVYLRLITFPFAHTFTFVSAVCQAQNANPCHPLPR
jgi:hypothetical protein